MKVVNLRKLADIQTGPFGSQLHKEDYVRFGTPIVTVEHLGKRTFTNQNLPCVSEKNRLRLKKYILQEGDIVFSRVGSVDRCSYVDNQHDGWMFSGRCLRVRPNSEIYPLYLYYFLQLEKVKQFIRNIAVGATMPSINTKLLGEVEILVPEMDIQIEIANRLSIIDDKIELNEKINDNLQLQIATIFKAVIKKNQEKFMIDYMPLKELCNVITKGTTPTTLGKSFTTYGINYIKAESITNYHAIDLKKIAFIDETTNQKLKRSILKEGDIIFTIAGTLGRFSLIDKKILPANTNQAIAIIRANREKISSNYLYSCFLGNWHNEYYSKHVQQAVQANLSLSTIKALPIPILTDQQMSQYLDAITPRIIMIKQTESENSYLENLRDTLLPYLISSKEFN